jgi:hypothetical protein
MFEKLNRGRPWWTCFRGYSVFANNRIYTQHQPIRRLKTISTWSVRSTMFGKWKKRVVLETLGFKKVPTSIKFLNFLNAIECTMKKLWNFVHQHYLYIHYMIEPSIICGFQYCFHKLKYSKSFGINNMIIKIPSFNFWASAHYIR